MLAKVKICPESEKNAGNSFPCIVRNKLTLIAELAFRCLAKSAIQLRVLVWIVYGWHKLKHCKSHRVIKKKLILVCV